MSISISIVNSDSTFAFQAVDRSNHRYHLALKIDPDFSMAYQFLTKLLLSKAKHPTNSDVKILANDKKGP